MYCTKCGKLKSECICNKKKEKKSGASMPIIITIVVITVLLVIGVTLGVFVFTNESVSVKELGHAPAPNETDNYEPDTNSHSGLEYHENPNYKPVDEDDDYVMTRFTNKDDEDTYVDLYASGKIKGKRNYCAGYNEFTGTYKKVGSTITFYYDNVNKKDIFEFDDEDFMYITKMVYQRGDAYMTTCSSEEFRFY